MQVREVSGFAPVRVSYRWLLGGINSGYHEILFQEEVVKCVKTILKGLETILKRLPAILKLLEFILKSLEPIFQFLVGGAARAVTIWLRPYQVTS
jgi:hypothetical protein